MWNQFQSCSKCGRPEQSYEKPLVPLKQHMEHAWSSGTEAQTHDHTTIKNIVSLSPATASVFVFLGKKLNLNLIRCRVYLVPGAASTTRYVHNPLSKITVYLTLSW